MMPFILLLVGLFMIFLEFYLPGAIMGTIGGLFVLASVVLFASESSSILAIILFFLLAAVSVGILIRFALWRIVNAKPGYSIYSNQDQEGYQASSYDATAIGKKGTVLSDLKPGGYILVEGKQHPAISISGYVSKGEEVIVISGQEANLLVKQIKKDHS